MENYRKISLKQADQQSMCEDSQMTYCNVTELENEVEKAETAVQTSEQQMNCCKCRMDNIFGDSPIRRGVY